MTNKPGPIYPQDVSRWISFVFCNPLKPYMHKNDCIEQDSGNEESKNIEGEIKHSDDTEDPTNRVIEQ